MEKPRSTTRRCPADLQIAQSGDRHAPGHRHAAAAAFQQGAHGQHVAGAERALRFRGAAQQLRHGLAPLGDAEAGGHDPDRRRRPGLGQRRREPDGARRGAEIRAADETQAPPAARQEMPGHAGASASGWRPTRVRSRRRSPSSE